MTVRDWLLIDPTPDPALEVIRLYEAKWCEALSEIDRLKAARKKAGAKRKDDGKLKDRALRGRQKEEQDRKAAEAREARLAPAAVVVPRRVSIMARAIEEALREVERRGNN